MHKEEDKDISSGRLDSIDDVPRVPCEKIVVDNLCFQIGRIVKTAVDFAVKIAKPILPECVKNKELPVSSKDIVSTHMRLICMMHDFDGQFDILSEDSFMHAVQANMIHNFQIWHLEDEARRTDVPDYNIATLKRSIDAENQQRNDEIEKIDDILVKQLPRVALSLPFNSETPGSVIDRLSIISLKIYHVSQELRREDTSETHKANCETRLTALVSQRKNLAIALDLLLYDLFNGRKRLTLYRPFKMYNDPNLNPSLYRKNV